MFNIKIILMKKLYLLTVIILSLFSCNKDDEVVEKEINGPIQPLYTNFLVNKNSELYKELDKAFSKNDYEFDKDNIKRYKNVYFVKGQEKLKLIGLLDTSNRFDNPTEPVKRTLYSLPGVTKDYAYLFMSYWEFPKYIFTGKKEDFALVYDDKTINLSVKVDKITKNKGFRFIIKEFYVNGKKSKFITGPNILSYNPTFFLEK